MARCPAPDAREQPWLPDITPLHNCTNKYVLEETSDFAAQQTQRTWRWQKTERDILSTQQSTGRRTLTLGYFVRRRQTTHVSHVQVGIYEKRNASQSQCDSTLDCELVFHESLYKATPLTWTDSLRPCLKGLTAGRWVHLIFSASRESVRSVCLSTSVGNCLLFTYCYFFYSWFKQRNRQTENCNRKTNNLEFWQAKTKGWIWHQTEFGRKTTWLMKLQLLKPHINLR